LRTSHNSSLHLTGSACQHRPYFEIYLFYEFKAGIADLIMESAVPDDVHLPALLLKPLGLPDLSV
jgi:hypothetical protein